MPPVTGWSVRLLIGGQVYSDRLTGTIRVEAEESTARIAEFTIAPQSGPIVLPNWVGATVQIDFRRHASDGSVTSEDRLFTGRMELPEYDFTRHTISCRASDGLPERQEAMEKAAIAAEVQGHWAAAMFGEEVDGWQYTQDRLSTQPAAFDLDVYGQPRLTPWAAKSTPDYTLTGDGFVYGSALIELAPRRELTNRVDVEIRYRFTRRRWRAHQLGWAWPGDFCDWFNDATNLPSRSMVRDAIDGAGWGLQSISYTALLPSTPDPCGTGLNWIIAPEIHAELILAFSAQLHRRIAQPVTEKYTLTVQAPQSIAAHGEITTQDRGALETPDEDPEWENSADPTIDPAATQDSLGDWILDQADRQDSDNAIVTAIEVERAAILDAHRRNRVTVQGPLLPDLDRHHTVRISAPQVLAQGKVFVLVHEISIDTGQATTQTSIAVSRAGAAPSAPETPRTAPAAPDTTPAIAAPAPSSSLPTQLGGKLSSPVYDDDLAGYSGNYSTIIAGSEVYPVRFTAEAPEIEEEVRGQVEGTQAGTYDIHIPNELLEVTVP